MIQLSEGSIMVLRGDGSSAPFDADELQSRIIKSCLAKVQNRFNVSAAEVEHQDQWRRAGLGFCCVSNEAGHADSMMSSVLDFLEADPEMEIVDVATEVIHI